jgi:hypothetical protein
MQNIESNFENEELIDMKCIPISERPNIGIEDMVKYKNGGLTVESREKNGALVYIPYGIYVDLFNAIDTGVNAINGLIVEREKFKKSMETWNDDPEYIRKFKENTNYIIGILQRDMDILKSVYPMKNNV